MLAMYTGAVNMDNSMEVPQKDKHYYNDSKNPLLGIQQKIKH